MLVEKPEQPIYSPDIAEQPQSYGSGVTRVFLSTTRIPINWPKDSFGDESFQREVKSIRTGFSEQLNQLHAQEGYSSTDEDRMVFNTKMALRKAWDDFQTREVFETSQDTHIDSGGAIRSIIFKMVSGDADLSVEFIVNDRRARWMTAKNKGGWAVLYRIGEEKIIDMQTHDAAKKILNFFNTDAKNRLYSSGRHSMTPILRIVADRRLKSNEDVEIRIVGEKEWTRRVG